MKYKLQSKQELAAIADIFKQLFDAALERADTSNDDGLLSQSDFHGRMVALHLLELCNDTYKQGFKTGTAKPSIRINAVEGLALLSAWYNTDATTLPMTPLSAALMNDITDKLVKAYCGPIIVQR